MNILEQYADEVSKDLYIDEFNLKEKTLKTPALKHSWVCKLIQHKKKLLKLKSDKNDLRREITKQIIKESPVKINAPVAEKAAARHDKLIDINKQIEEQELIVEFLEKTEKTFSALGFDIKNIIETIKIETM